MNQDNDFNSFFDNLMTYEAIEDNGFSELVLKQIRKETSFSWIKENLLGLFSFTAIMAFFRIDLFLMNFFLKILKTLDLITRFNGAEISFSINQSTIIIIAAGVVYLIFEKGPQILEEF